MTYLCKVLKEDFYLKFTSYLEELLGDTKEPKRELDRLMYYGYIVSIWNGENTMKEALITAGLDKPDCNEVYYTAEESGSYSHPEIMWEGEIKKIGDIEQIISYEAVSDEEMNKTPY